LARALGDDGTACGAITADERFKEAFDEKFLGGIAARDWGGEASFGH
jgi:hypothetical protein